MKRRTKNILKVLAMDMPARFTDIKTFFIRKEDPNRETKFNSKGKFLTAFLDSMVFKSGQAQPVNNFRTLKKEYSSGKMPAAWLRSQFKAKPIPANNYEPMESTPEAPQHKAQFMSRQGCLIIVALLAASYLLIYFLVL